MIPPRTSVGRAAFTLIELLVVIAIIAILASLFLPMLGRVQMRGYETKTLSNMRAMGVALMAYAGDNSYQLPGRVGVPAPGQTTLDKWPRVLQPYVQDLTMYGCPIADVGGKSYKVSNPLMYVNQNDTNYTSYIYNGGNDSAPDASTATTVAVAYPRLNVINQPQKTILLGVPLPQANNFYMDFTEKNNNDILNKTAFVDGTPYVFADGSSRVLTVDPKYSRDPTFNKTEPVSSATYADWLWLFDKSRTDIIQ